MMLLFFTGSLVWLGVLAGAGYSHYRYRVKNDRIYREQFGESMAGNLVAGAVRDDGVTA